MNDEQGYKIKWLETKGRALAAYHHLLTPLCRFSIHGREHTTKALASGRPLLFVFWHGQITPMLLYLNRFWDPTQYVMVTLGGDDRGVILAQFARSMRATPFAVDMDGNPMAAGRSVLRIIQEMKRGKHSFIAPDGPGGPAGVLKPGALYLAKKARAVIVPAGAYGRPAYNLRRWDRYNLPLPFSRVHIELGAPIFPQKNADETELAARLTTTLHLLQQRARGE